MADSIISITRTLLAEGGYSNNPADPGGETMHGVTITEARQYGYTGPMAELPMDVARAFYKATFWDPMRLDGVNNQKIADQVLQGAVNQGMHRWCIFLQEAVNWSVPSFNHVIVDGIIGPETLRAVNFTDIINTYKNLSRALYNLQMTRYNDLVAKNPKLAFFQDGWKNRAVNFLIT